VDDSLAYSLGLGVKRNASEAEKWRVKSAAAKKKLWRDKLCSRGYKYTKFLGDGSYGVVYIACKKEEKESEECKYAAKIQFKDLGTYRDEVKLIKLFNTKGVGPKLIEDWECTIYGITYGFMIIDRWDGELEIGDKLNERLVNKLQSQLEAIWELGYIHLDIKPPNILVKRNDRKEITDVNVTDFGLTEKKDSDNFSKRTYWEYHSSMYLNNPFDTTWKNPQIIDTAMLEAIRKNGYIVPDYNINLTE
jgi:serine/threonine protein kinase